MTGAGGWLGNDAPLRHGYTMARLYELTLIAVRCERWYRHRDFHERADIAWSAIAEHLYAAGEPPSRSDLIRAGMLAIGAHYDKDWAQYGIYPKDRYAETGVNFERYWAIAARPTPGPEERVVERAALRQIWHELTHGQREALTALAVHDDYGRAADALGKRHSTFNSQISVARQAFLALWHEGERPSRPWGHDRRRDSTVRQHNVTTVLKRRLRKRPQAPSATGPGTGQPDVISPVSPEL